MEWFPFITGDLKGIEYVIYMLMKDMIETCYLVIFEVAVQLILWFN